MSHVLLLFNRVTARCPAEDLDVLKQVLSVESAARELGHRVSRLACGMDLEVVRHTLTRSEPDVVFNLVESLGGTDRLLPVATLLLESLGIPYTGGSSLALLTTTQKVECKRRMVSAGLPTPLWMCAGQSDWQGPPHRLTRPDRVIIKAVAEHASFGLSAGSIRDARQMTDAEIGKAALDASRLHGTPHFAEAFVPGREFNLSVLAGPDGPTVLPPAEIDFHDFDPDQPQIVGHAAKWNEDSPEYIQTPRSFDFSSQDLPLLDELMALSRSCWQEFDLHGWARVDFRVDADGQPWILEINANPCLSPDAGFAAAAARAGLRFPDVIKRILADLNAGTRQ